MAAVAHESAGVDDAGAAVAVAAVAHDAASVDDAVAAVAVAAVAHEAAGVDDAGAAVLAVAEATQKAAAEPAEAANNGDSKYARPQRESRGTAFIQNIGAEFLRHFLALTAH